MSGKLPPVWEKRIKSAYLKEKIIDDGMWCFIPPVDYSIDSVKGERRLKQNEALFSFIDTYFPEGGFDFEPNMRDGRFMFLPEDVAHQGMAVCASLVIPDALEVGHFWYPCDFSRYRLPDNPDQVYVPMFTTLRDDLLIDMVKDIYTEQEPQEHGPDAPYHPLCDFPFYLGLSVRLEGYFMDDVEASARIIEDALSDQPAQIRRNGEGLTMFMRKLAPLRPEGRR